MKKQNIQDLVLAGILATLVFVTTSFTMIKLPFTIAKDTYIHIGDCIIFLSASLLAPLHTAFISGLGSFFADLYLGAPHYLMATLTIKAIMGAITGFFLYHPKNHVSPTKTILGLIIGGIWMVLSYYIYEVGVLGVNALANIPNLLINLIQTIINIIIYFPLTKILQNIKIFNR